MNKTSLILIIIVIVIVAVGGYYFLYNGNKGSMYGTATPSNTNYTPNTSVPPSTNTPATNTPPATATPTPQPQNLSASVSIKNFAFNPTPLNVKVGTKVVWTNNDTVPHQIKSATFNSTALSSGQTFSFTFSTAGTYNYSCAIHPSMHGQIIVSQ
jgi:plastocyanin